METLDIIAQRNNETRNTLPAESCHWYDKQGQPRYTIIGKNGKERATTLRDAREHGWLPSVTEILNVAAKPGLEAWKAKQILEAALTLPKLPDESLDDYATRVIEDSKAQGKKAMERGTELHAAIELDIQQGPPSEKWDAHLQVLWKTLSAYGIDIYSGKAEHSFSSPLGYGGKLDWHNEEALIDFKTKDRIIENKQLAWPEHCWQLAAYDQGVCVRRLLNVFIGVEDCQVRIHEWKPTDAEQGWEVFKHLLSVWKITKNYNP
jgi:hypothetical protein